MSAKLTSYKYWQEMVNQTFLKFYVMKLIEQERVHGYILPAKIKQIYGEVFRSPSPGSLYNTLSRLEKDGYLKSSVQKVASKYRKVYLLTVEGKLALQVATKIFSDILPLMQQLVRPEVISQPSQPPFVAPSPASGIDAPQDKPQPQPQQKYYFPHAVKTTPPSSPPRLTPDETGPLRPQT